MITALSSGGLGDIVYSIPIMRALNVQTLYVKKTHYLPQYGTLYSAICSLVQSQGFICHPYSDLPLFQYDPTIPISFDIDRFRDQPNRGINHIMISMRRQFKLKNDDWKLPWLKIDGEFTMPEGQAIEKPYSILHLTERWRGAKLVNWKKVLQGIDHKIYFTGFQHEWIDFCSHYCDIAWMPTDDILDMARLIKGAQSLYCNQSVALTLAQGMGKNYFLEKKPNKSNTLLFTENEHLLK